jgi:voltage-gated potassium channel
MTQDKENSKKLPAWRRSVHTVIFEADTPAGKLFDVTLLILIVLSIIAVMLESVEPIQQKYGSILQTTEWILTILFTMEYVLRIISVRKPLKYMFSFYGLVDLVSIVPTYLSLVLVGAQTLATVRSLRLLRVFRILKMGRFLKEAHVLKNALMAARPKIAVFLLAILTTVTIMGTIIYMIEDAAAGFTSIPRSIYWAIVTLTTVGYGDIAPETVLGQFFASIIMIMGYAIIAVPTGIVSAEIARGPKSKDISTQSCPTCSKEGHEKDAQFCKHCGSDLH